VCGNNLVNHEGEPRSSVQLSRDMPRVVSEVASAAVQRNAKSTTTSVVALGGNQSQQRPPLGPDGFRGIVVLPHEHEAKIPGEDCAEVTVR
jgi:hypothetical protein